MYENVWELLNGMFLIISVHGALTQIRIRAYPWATANQKKALVTDVTGLLPEGAVRPDLPPHSDNCKRYHTYCSNEDQTGSPVCPSQHTRKGGRGEQHGTLWGPHRFACNVCMWRSVGAKWEMWSYMKRLEDAGDTKRRRSESSQMWSLAEGSASLSCESRGWSGSFSHKFEVCFQRGSCTFEQNKATISLLWNLENQWTICLISSRRMVTSSARLFSLVELSFYHCLFITV